MLRVFLSGKMAALVNGKADCFLFFLVVYWGCWRFVSTTGVF